MATQKPQAKNKQTGEFVDPLAKWLDDLPSLAEDTNKPTKKSAKASKDLQELAQTLVTDPDKASEHLQRLLSRLSSPSLSRAERMVLQKELREARKSIKESSAKAVEASRNILASKQLEASTYAKLNRLRNLRSNGDLAGYDQDTLKAIKTTESRLQELLKLMPTLRSSAESEDVRKAFVAKLEHIDESVKKLPEFWQTNFNEDQSKLDQVLKAQKDAREFVKSQNEAIAAMGMKIADRVGIGVVNLGNLIRVTKATAALPGRLASGIKDFSSRVSSGSSYVRQTLEARRLSNAKVVPALIKAPTEDKTLEPASTLAETSRSTNETLTRYVNSSERFMSRLLNKVGKPNKDKAQEDPTKGLADLFGSGGLLKTLLGLAGKVSAVGIAGAIGYWVGKQIWERVGPTFGQWANKASGLDDAVSRMTAPAQLNTETNFAKAQIIRQAIVEKRAKDVSPSDLDFYKQFKTDNPDVDLTKPYAPNARVAQINAKQFDARGTGSFARSDRPAVDTAISQSHLLNSTAGAGRGFVNPSVVLPDSTGNLPSSSVQPDLPSVSSGSQLISDWLGKTIRTSGQVDTAGLHETLQSNLVGMAKEYQEATGKQLTLTSGKRSNEHQERLYRSMPPGMAAPPGRSLHNYGLAVDMDKAQANELANLGLLQKYGFNRPVPGEPHHVQPVGMTVAAARAGIYSADSPVHQGYSTPEASYAQSQQRVQTVQAQTLGVNVEEAEAPTQLSSAQTAALDGKTRTTPKDTIGANNKQSASSIPTFNQTDGLLLAVNLSVL